MKVLLTGGAGYIGSHAAVVLLAAGHDVGVLDNFANSRPEVLDRVLGIAGRRPALHELDLLDQAGVAAVLARGGYEAVLHFAGLKAVGESVRLPLRYYAVNVSGTISLLQAMQDTGVRRIVFSSSATVYGQPRFLPYTEAHPLAPANPYGRGKLYIEEILRDAHAADPDLAVSVLRYFNPVGAHESGLIGEDPLGIPNNLVPYIGGVALGRLPRLAVFGGDYPTRDGTGVRDYIHVMDLAEAHLKALELLERRGGFFVHNLGTGTGYSVLEVIRAFERASGRAVPWVLAPRREGDVAEYWADPALAERELGWSACRGLERMMADTWRWYARSGA